VSSPRHLPRTTASGTTQSDRAPTLRRPSHRRRPKVSQLTNWVNMEDTSLTLLSLVSQDKVMKPARKDKRSGGHKGKGKLAKTGNMFTNSRLPIPKGGW
jgi:hypothetical protein